MQRRRRTAHKKAVWVRAGLAGIFFVQLIFREISLQRCFDSWNQRCSGAPLAKGCPMRFVGYSGRLITPPLGTALSSGLQCNLSESINLPTFCDNAID